MLQQIQKHRRSPDQNYRFSVLVPTWNNLECLQLCVEGLRQHSAYQHQIIIHVNEGKDGTLEWLKTQPDLDYTTSRDNVGVCYGLNMARTLVKADYICYLNDDMFVLPEWDVHLWAEIERIGHASFLLSGTAIEPRESGNSCVLVQDFGDSPKSLDREGLLREYRTVEMADWSGSTWPPVVLHRDLWDLVGGLSIEFSPGMYSDPDLSMKLWHAGVRHFRGIGKSRVYHFGSKSTKRKRMNRGRDIFLLKWGIDSSTFTKQYLRRGRPFTGLLEMPVVPTTTRLLAALKRGWHAFRQKY
ncbi:MAG: glycosyltransferase family 2 protein [Saprospiraceae bacterium]